MNKILNSSLSSLLTLLIFLFVCKDVIASTEFSYSKDKKIETVIAFGELNRIQINNGEITEVIGDENKYALYWSGDWRHLFIKPKVEVGEVIELTIIAAHGDAQDIRFTVGDLSAQTILINMGESSTAQRVALKPEISKMMRAMIEGKKGKYYIINSKRILQKTKERHITQDIAYRFGDLSGAILSVKNHTTKALKLNESDFKNLFKNAVAINVSSSVIKRGELAKVFIITRDGHDD